MKKDVFIETHCVTALRDAVMSALAEGEGQPAMVMASGEAGTGKTRAARTLYAQSGGVYLRALEAMSQNAFLQEIAFELAGLRPHGVARAKREIVSRLRDDPCPIYIDEADRLHISRLEDLRDIHDVTGSPVVMIGETALPARLTARARINDRIPGAYRVAFDAITPGDVLAFAAQAAGLRLSPEALALVYKETRGNFRRVHNAIQILEAAAKTAGVHDVSAELCRAALAAKSNRRGTA